MNEYYPSLSALGSALSSFLDRTLHGLEGTLAEYSEALSGLREKIGLTTVFPKIISDHVFSIESQFVAQMFETLAILKDKEFTDAIIAGRRDVKDGRIHNFSELLSEYGIE